jgi:tetratricopeptide (TPR) repeat protein
VKQTVYQEEEKLQTRRRQSDTAIQLAMANRWEEAAQVNKSILSLFPNDVDSHNRLGKALMELGKLNEAKKAYKKALELDTTNMIARKNLERIGTLAKAGAGQVAPSQIDPSLFIEEMGKTAITNLQQTKPKVLATLNAGDRLELRRKGNTLYVETPSGDVIGTVEPKLTLRMLKLMDGGNQYAAGVTSVSADECRIIIKETFQHPSLAGRPSFPTAIATEGLRPYTKGSLIRHSAAAEEQERDEEGDDDSGDASSGDNWDNDTVVQEGEVRLNDAAAAEDADDDDMDD